QGEQGGHAACPPRGASRRLARGRRRSQVRGAGHRHRAATDPARGDGGAEAGGNANLKSEIRSTKSETNSNLELRMIKPIRPSFGVFLLWSLTFVSDFDIRISDFLQGDQSC